MASSSSTLLLPLETGKKSKSNKNIMHMIFCFLTNCKNHKNFLGQCVCHINTQHNVVLGSSCGKSRGIGCTERIRGLVVRCWNSEVKDSTARANWDDELKLSKRRREVIGLMFGVASVLVESHHVAKGAGLPPEQKPRLCDDACEKELENVPTVTTESGLQYKDIKVGEGPSPPVGFQVAANYVAMVPSGQIFDSSLEKGQPYIFRVGSGQVIKGLDEGMLSMKTGGKRRLYIPGSLAFPKGLTSAPGRPRVAPNSPVVFDVSLEYIPGLELDFAE